MLYLMLFHPLTHKYTEIKPAIILIIVKIQSLILLGFITFLIKLYNMETQKSIITNQLGPFVVTNGPKK